MRLAASLNGATGGMGRERLKAMLPDGGIHASAAAGRFAGQRTFAARAMERRSVV